LTKRKVSSYNVGGLRTVHEGKKERNLDPSAPGEGGSWNQKRIGPWRAGNKRGRKLKPFVGVI